MKAKRKSKLSNVTPFPVNNIDATGIAAANLRVEIWNLLVDQIDADFPIEWAAGILDSVKIELLSLEDEE